MVVHTYFVQCWNNIKKNTNQQNLLPGLREDLLHLLLVRLLQRGDGRLVFVILGVQSVNNLGENNGIKDQPKALSTILCPKKCSEKPFVFI